MDALLNSNYVSTPPTFEYLPAIFPVQDSGERSSSDRSSNATCAVNTDLGELIGSVLKSDAHKVAISGSWESMFCEPSCPLCTEPFRMPSSSEAYDNDLQTFPNILSEIPLPSTAKHNSSISELRLEQFSHTWDAWRKRWRWSTGDAAWIKRGLTRSRDESETYKPDSVRVTLPNNTYIDIWHPFDFHCIRHAVVGTDDALIFSLQNSQPVKLKGGKSESLFNISMDKRLVIKSVNTREETFFKQMGPSLFWYYTKSMFHPIPSVLTPVLGLFTVTRPGNLGPQSYIVMPNIDYPAHLHCRRYDLKGVGTKRGLQRTRDNTTDIVDETSRDELASMEQPSLAEDTDAISVVSGSDELRKDSSSINEFDINTVMMPPAVMWDQDFRDWRGDVHFKMRAYSGEFLQLALKNDSQFLAALRVVDYSFYVCVDTESLTITGGIIDYLRPYTWEKKLESVVKTVNANIASIRVIPKFNDGPYQCELNTVGSLVMETAPTIIRPDLYARRFSHNIGLQFTMAGVNCCKSILDKLGIVEAHVRKISPMNPKVGLKRIIKSGLRKGYWEFFPDESIANVGNITAIVKMCAKLDANDTRFLSSLEGLLAEERANSSEWVQLIGEVTRMGYSSETLILQASTSILRNGLDSLSDSDIALWLNVLDRQGVSDSELCTLLSRRIFQNGNETCKIRALRSLSNLGISPPGGIPIRSVPVSLGDRVELLTALLMSDSATEDQNVVASLLIPTLNRLGDVEPEHMLKYWSGSPTKAREMNVIRHALIYCHSKTIYSKLSDPARRLLADCENLVTAPLNPTRQNFPNEKFIDSVGKILFRNNIAFVSGTQIGPFHMDIVERDAPVVWECNSSHRYYKGEKSRSKRAYYIMQDRILLSMGYKIVQIPYWHWQRIIDKRMRSDYCRTSRFMVTSAGLSSTGNNGLSPPTLFDARSVAMTEYQGETFFKKGAPKQQWSWAVPSPAPLPLRMMLSNLPFEFTKDQLWMLGLGTTALIGIYTATKWMKKSHNCQDTSTSISLCHLIDPAIRGDHESFNRRLLKEFPEADAIDIGHNDSGVKVFLVHKYKAVQEVLSNHASFSSNPWLNSRPLVTLNTMDKANHDRLYRIVRQFYTSSAIRELQDTLDVVVNMHAERLKVSGDAYQFAKRLHMHISLISSGLFPSVSIDDPLINRFIEWNDIAVKLVAPLGGIGVAPVRSFKSLRKMFSGLVDSIPPLLRLIGRIGISETWKLINPLEVVCPSFPYTQVWVYPELFRHIPEYFNVLYDLMKIADPCSPAGALYGAVGESITAAEALGTTVQLMVNMTAANEIMSFIYRRCCDRQVSIDDVLNNDPALQRNPRRAICDSVIGSCFIPKGSLLLLMIGAANMDRPKDSTLLTFGFGLHYCLGRHLVSMELNLLDRWLEQELSNTNLCLVGEPLRLVDVDVGNWGFSHIHVKFDTPI